MTFIYLFITPQVALIANSVGGLGRTVLYKTELENSNKEAVYSVSIIQVSTLDNKEFNKNKLQMPLILPQVLTKNMYYPPSFSFCNVSQPRKRNVRQCTFSFCLH